MSVKVRVVLDLTISNTAKDLAGFKIGISGELVLG